jgi:hypothetical protein
MPYIYHVDLDAFVQFRKFGTHELWNTRHFYFTYTQKHHSLTMQGRLPQMVS